MKNNATSQEDVVAIIVNWNGKSCIGKCLESLDRQTRKFDRIIVVDNASTDNSPKIISQFPAVELMQIGYNAGFACGNNLALQTLVGKCRWVALINPDAFVTESWLETLLAASTTYPNAASFGGTLLNETNPLILDGVGDVYHCSGLVWRKGHGMLRTSVQAVNAEVFSPCAAAALYQYSAIHRLNFFDEDFFCYMEDIDLGFRLQLSGYNSMQIHDAIAHHIGSAITGHRSEFSIYHGHRNLVWVFFKNMPTPLLIFLVPLHLCLNIATIVFFLTHGKAKTILLAKKDALLGLPRMIAKRKKNHLPRKLSVWGLASKLSWKWK